MFRNCNAYFLVPSSSKVTPSRFFRTFEWRFSGVRGLTKPQFLNFFSRGNNKRGNHAISPSFTFFAHPKHGNTVVISRHVSVHNGFRNIELVEITFKIFTITYRTDENKQNQKLFFQYFYFGRSIDTLLIRLLYRGIVHYDRFTSLSRGVQYHLEEFTAKRKKMILPCHHDIIIIKS